MNHYSKFLSSTLEEGISDENLLPSLSFLAEKGNVTVYQFIHGEEPLSIEEEEVINDNWLA